MHEHVHVYPIPAEDVDGHSRDMSQCFSLVLLGQLLALVHVELPQPQHGTLSVDSSQTERNHGSHLGVKV